MKFVCFAVVLLRGCWMQAVEQCLEDKDATVCTCKGDLCNSATPTHIRGLPLQLLCIVNVIFATTTTTAAARLLLL